MAEVRCLIIGDESDLAALKNFVQGGMTVRPLVCHPCSEATTQVGSSNSTY